MNTIELTTSRGTEHVQSKTIDLAAYRESQRRKQLDAAYRRNHPPRRPEPPRAA